MSTEYVHYVTSFDDDNIYLKRGGIIPGRVTIQRDKVTAVDTSLGMLTVRMPGAVYKVSPGFRKEKRDRTREAFAQWNVQIR